MINKAHYTKHGNENNHPGRVEVEKRSGQRTELRDPPAFRGQAREEPRCEMLFINTQQISIEHFLCQVLF